MWTDLSTVLSQSTRVTDRRKDGRTDRQTELFSSLDRVCIPCSAVKMNVIELAKRVRLAYLTVQNIMH